MVENKRPSQEYSQLKQQITVENKVFSTRKNTFLQALTLICTSCFTKQEIKKQFDYFVSILDDELSDISLSLEYSVLYYLSYINNISPPDKLAKYVKSVCTDAITINNIPLSTRALIAYFLKNSNIKDKKLSDNIQMIYHEAQNVLESGNIAAAIDGFFAADRVDDSIINQILDGFKKNINQFSREKIAKLTLCTLRWNCKQYNYLLNCLEDAIQTDLQCYLTPDIQFALVESEKLINSNLPAEIINDILDTLKNAGEYWTNTIESFKDNGVIVDLKTFKNMPSFSPTEDVWSVLALEAGNRTNKYQLDTKEFNVYQQLMEIHNKGKQSTYKGAILLTISSTILSVLITCCLFCWWPKINYSLQNLTNIVTSPANLGEWLNFIKNPLIIVAVLITWLSKNIHYFILKRDLSLSIIFKKIPIFSLILKLFKGDKDN